ncbi:MAG: hypothetical protein ACLR4Z_02415 [Butyricicoccaceae bacterium]
MDFPERTRSAGRAHAAAVQAPARQRHRRADARTRICCVTHTMMSISSLADGLAMELGLSHAER